MSEMEQTSPRIHAKEISRPSVDVETAMNSDFSGLLAKVENGEALNADERSLVAYSILVRMANSTSSDGSDYHLGGWGNQTRISTGSSEIDSPTGNKVEVEYEVANPEDYDKEFADVGRDVVWVAGFTGEKDSGIPYNDYAIVYSVNTSSYDLVIDSDLGSNHETDLIPATDQVLMLAEEISKKMVSFDPIQRAEVLTDEVYNETDESERERTKYPELQGRDDIVEEDYPSLLSRRS